jgi:penicillin G amidase
MAPLRVLAILAATSRALPAMAASVPPELAERARASLPQTSGRLALSGLRAPVEVRRDRWGIPHIYATTVEDLFFAQGFVQAQDRLFQMEIWRRSTRGRLAELLGPDWVERDRLTRLVTRYRGDREAEWTSYDPEAKGIVASFVRGVNAHIALLAERRPLEVERAGIRLEPWAPEDLLARAEAFGMSSNATSEVSRAQLVRSLGLAGALELKPPDPPVELLVPPGLDLAAVDGDLADALGLIGRSPRFTAANGRRNSGYDDDGSNNWVVAGHRTATGKPILANDPHRRLDHPSLRYLVHLDGPGFKVIGAVVPWFPGVAIGHNERIGWGLTIFNIDAQDLFAEELHPKDPGRYRVGSGWERVRVEREVIGVKGRGPVTVELRFTRHGPIVREDRVRNMAWALRWTGSEPGTAGYLAGLALDRAQGWSQFREALKRWKMPGENFVYADVDGNVGYQAAGLAPVRRKGNGLLPVPGAPGEFDWDGWVPQDELPHAFNPDRGFLATANHKTLAPDARHVVGYEWSNRFRIDRILEVLGSIPRMTVSASQALQQDVVALPARTLVPLLKDVMPAAPAVRQARDLLLRWDGRLETESAAAAVFAAWHIRLAADYVQGRLPEGTSVDTALVRSAGAQVLLDGLRRSGPERDRLLLGALERAVADVSATLGADLPSWRWGDLHRATFSHPVAVDEPTRALFDRGPLRRPGYGYTVNMTGGGDFEQRDGASFREVLDVADWDRSVATSAPGQSGAPASPHFDDLIPYWTEGRYFPLAFSRQKVEAVTEAVLVLEPAR